MKRTLKLTGFSRPHRVRWFFTGDRENCLAAIRSKSLRKFLSQADEHMAAHGITWTFAPITKETYLKWLPYYTEKMRELRHDVLAKPEWYDERTADGKTVHGLFFYKENTMVGSGIITELNGTYTLAFKASEFLSLSSQSNSSLGSLIDFIFIRTLCEKNVSVICGGRSYNAFGAETTLGYLEFKTNFYTPRFIADEEIFTTLPLPEDPAASCACFVTRPSSPTELVLAVYTNSLTAEQVEKQYASPGIERVFLPYESSI